LVSYPFLEIELEHECDPEPQLGNSIPLFDSILTTVSLLDCNHFPESVLNFVLVHRQIESPIFQDQHFELDYYHTFESPIDKLESFYFYEIELEQECDTSQFCDSVSNFESILTHVLLSKLSNMLEPGLIFMPVILEIESPILQNHIPFSKNEFLGLDHFDSKTFT